jgi:hypothetical protein
MIEPFSQTIIVPQEGQFIMIGQLRFQLICLVIAGVSSVCSACTLSSRCRKMSIGIYPRDCLKACQSGKKKLIPCHNGRTSQAVRRISNIKTRPHCFMELTTARFSIFQCLL